MSRVSLDSWTTHGSATRRRDRRSVCSGMRVVRTVSFQRILPDSFGEHLYFSDVQGLVPAKLKAKIVSYGQSKLLRETNHLKELHAEIRPFRKLLLGAIVGAFIIACFHVSKVVKMLFRSLVHAKASHPVRVENFAAGLSLQALAQFSHFEMETRTAAHAMEIWVVSAQHQCLDLR